MNRREFMMATAAAAVGTGINGARAEGMPPPPASRGLPGFKRDVPPRNRHPYKGIDWSSAYQIRTTSHVHCLTQADLDVLLGRLEMITLSNYYPSAPWWPLSKMTENYFSVHHDFPVTVKGKRVEGPFDWNKIIGEWIKDLPPEVQKDFPLKEGGKIFKPLPEGVLEAPNAEHHHFKGDDGKFVRGLHINAPGSTFSSGTFDKWGRKFQTPRRGGYDPGSGEHWATAIDHMIEGLLYPDGGGVTINHPVWSSYYRPLLLDILDHDQRVLGMEVIEGGRVNGEAYWDWVLATGRQCFGFCVPDHSIRIKDGSFGVNVLVTPEQSVHACLKAYRDGNFYGARRGLNELRFKRIVFDGTTVEAETDKPARFEVKTGVGIVKEVKEATSVKWTMEAEYSSSSPRAEAHIFARIKAYALDGSGEELFSQPYMLVPGR